MHKRVIAELKRLERGESLTIIRRDISKLLGLGKLLDNASLLAYLDSKARKKYSKYLLTKPVRTASGVAPLAVMTKPFACPHVKKGIGPCIMCPGGPGSSFGDTPQSYTGNEPAAQRAIRAKYDAYTQVFNRLEQYIVLGHLPEKVELIIMGGTFPSCQKKYQKDFVTSCFKAMNDFSKLFFAKETLNFEKFKDFFELPGSIKDLNRTKNIHVKVSKLKGDSSLDKEHRRNEKSFIKCVGMVIETRPDYGFLKHGNFMLELGCTRVELGVQSVYDSVLDKINRGHSVNDVKKSILELKDLGFKVNAHYMLGLPGSSGKLEGLDVLFSDPSFRPDMLKIYPTLLTKGTKLYDLYKKKKYVPLTVKQAAIKVAEFKRNVPRYVRIMRVQRDIPEKVVEAGVNRTNLRQDVQKILGDKNYKCQCIRCREVKSEFKDFKIDILEYEASKGQEFFISAVTDKDEILGFCRLRFVSKSLRKEITLDSAFIRELHVYGNLTSLGVKGKVQHRGVGKKLLNIAERLAKNNGKKKMLVISGIGARDYYRKLGYRKEGFYMSKKL
jgi:elongator complex protein 3